MLQDIRDNTQGVIAKVIVGLIVAVFALWGVESIIGGFITSASIAEVNGEEITEQQLAVSTQNLMAQLGGNLQNFDQSLLEQIALSQLIEEVLLRQAAEDAAMGISEERIDQVIIENPSFQLNGQFDTELAMRTIAAQQMNVPLFRQQLQRNMLLAQVANAYSSSNFVTDAELERIAALRLQSRDFRFLSLTLGTRTLGEAIPDDQIREYYDNNQDQFTVPERISVQYIELNKNDIANEIAIDESMAREQYEAERSTFEGAAERRASHILFETGPGLSEDEAMAQAVQAKQRLDAGEDFAELALELSSDTISAEDGGDIGYSDGTAFPQPIEEVLPGLAIDEVSEPVTTEFGVHLVKLTENTANEYATYDDVSERIERELKSAQAEQIYAERLENLSNMAFESPDLQPIAEQLNLELGESSLFSRSGGQGLFANQAVVTEAFSQDVRENDFNSNVVELNDSQAVVMHLLERQEAQVSPLDEVEGEIAVILRTEMERERVVSLGEEILEGLKSGTSIDTLLANNDLEWVSQTDIRRDSTAINREITNAVFALPRPNADVPVYDGVLLSNGTYVVVELNAVNSGNLALLPDAEREGIAESLMAEKSRSEFGSFINSLREEADITTRLSDPSLEDPL